MPAIGERVVKRKGGYLCYSFDFPPKFMLEASILSEKEEPKAQPRLYKEQKRR